MGSFAKFGAAITMETDRYEDKSRMTQVVLGENEGIDSALRRFKRQVSKAGILADVKYHRHFETPLEKRKRKAVAARRKRRFK
ncbi:ribosomal protein S21 [Tolypothrix sp. PCC 7601]|nr:ribosomal protein S21 [Tolypothrix sp. PCC 7601]